MMSSGVVEEIRAERGNLRYEYFYPANDKNTVLLIDSWESMEALDLHHHSSVMQKIMKIREKYDLHMKLERYISAEESDFEKYKSYIRE